MSNFWYTKKSKFDFISTVESVTNELKKEWFWVLTEIDMKKKFSQKLWISIWEYLILWACNPSLAYEALWFEYEIWLMLPCNIIVYEKDSEIYVSTILPTVAISVANNKDLSDLSLVVEEKLKRVIDGV